MAALFLAAFGLGIAFSAPPGVVTALAVQRGLAHGFGAALSVELGSLIGDAAWAGRWSAAGMRTRGRLSTSRSSPGS